ncbi:MAG: hypothetical protein Q7S71_00690 [Candidatus Nitrotoga sp.]|nr:hypothetical protein [Candidatus Nitrotoga sp.]
MNRILDAQNISKSTARSLSVFALAYLLSWGNGESLRTNQIFSALPSDGVSASKTIIKKVSPVFV